MLLVDARTGADASDAALVERVLDGDRSAFADVLRRHDDRLRGLAYKLLGGDRHRMDDVMQDAYIRAYRGLATFRRDAHLGSWLYRIVYNACIDDLRRRRDEVQLEQWDAGSPDPSTEDRLDLAAALRSLPAELRAVVLLIDAEGLSYTEAAEVLSLPAGTVASRLNRARSFLQAALKGVES